MSWSKKNCASLAVTTAIAVFVGRLPFRVVTQLYSLLHQASDYEGVKAEEHFQSISRLHDEISEDDFTSDSDKNRQSRWRL